MEIDNTIDTSSVEQVKKRKSKAQLHQEQDRNDLEVVLSTVGGRNVLWKVLTSCGIYKSSYDGDPTATVFREGRRAVGLELLATILTTSPQAYADMSLEATKRKDT